MRRAMAILVLTILAGVGWTAQLCATEVSWIKVTGAIGPATSSFIARAIDKAAARDDTCLIIQLDTPGGALDATREIVEKFYSSPIPIVVYVAPAGAWAGSAGCFITMAAHVAAMAPSTSIGAAHPVSVGLGGEEKMDDVMKKKVENLTSKYIESIADKRGRNAEWAKSSVIESEALSANKALENNVIDLIANDMPDLLKQLDGRELDGRTLKTAGAILVPIPMTFREKVLQVLSHPEMMLLFMLIAIYGIIGELSNPGAVLPGVAGAIALILLLYMASILPVNVAGLALVGLAVILFITDIYAPTHGVLTFGGIAAFFLGALMLFNRAEPGFQLSLAYIVPATLLTAAFFIFVVGAGVRAQFLPVRAGKETMLGKTVTSLDRIDPAGGRVFVEGEYWNAVSTVPIEADRPVKIVAVEGLTLKVAPA
ncbi:MAG: hypothetical protein C5B50_01300 [Verrucomicrobia bacterium]|nr:MAG: hypothetical protein C5B50_01300 [Verrucomicrobiota bacterium]